MGFAPRRGSEGTEVSVRGAGSRFVVQDEPGEGVIPGFDIGNQSREPMTALAGLICEEGGLIVAEGTPEEVAAVPESYTGQYLKAMLARGKASASASTRSRQG